MMIVLWLSTKNELFRQNSARTANVESVDTVYAYKWEIIYKCHSEAIFQDNKKYYNSCMKEKLRRAI